MRKPRKLHIDPRTSTTFVPKHQMEKVHVDTVGPIKKSLEGHRYFVTLVDGYTDFIKVIPTKNKKQITRKLIVTLKQLQTEMRHQLKCLFSDNGTEFINSTMQSFLSSNGIRHEKSNSYQPSENGKVERQHRIVLDCAKKMLLATGLPLHFLESCSNSCS